jgi:dipeptide/tripeptide permease
VLHAVALLTVACLFYAAAAYVGIPIAVGVLVLAVVAHSFGEILSEAGGWELAFELADSRAAGAYQGISQTGVAVGTALSPAVVTTTAISHGTPGWLLLGAVFLAAGAGTALTVRPRLHRAGDEPGARWRARRGLRRGGGVRPEATR